MKYYMIFHRRSSATLVLTAVVAFVASAPVVLQAQRSDTDFNRDWRFAKGIQPEVVRELNYDDSSWELVRLPHDS